MALLKVDQISYAYPKQPSLFTNVSFTVRPGEILTILGPNGVGKSTLLRCLLGLTPVASGAIYLNSHKLTRLNRRQIAQQVAIVSQDYRVRTNLSVNDFLLTGRAPYINPLQVPGEQDQKLVDRQLAHFNLTAIKEQPFSSLSGGQQQLVTIIKSLVQQPQILILDEPLAALDLNRQSDVLTMLQSLASAGMAIILTTHLPDHAFMLNSMTGLFFPDGQLKFGKSQQIMTAKNLTSVYQTPLTLTYLPKLRRYTCQIKL